MTDPSQGPEAGTDHELDAEVAREPEYEDDEPRNPFDNPWFLPLMLGAFALWCGYDGFLTDKYHDEPSTLWFNRITFVALGAIALWLGLRARREVQAGPGDEA